MFAGSGSLFASPPSFGLRAPVAAAEAAFPAVPGGFDFSSSGTGGAWRQPDAPPSTDARLSRVVQEEREARNASERARRLQPDSEERNPLLGLHQATDLSVYLSSPGAPIVPSEEERARRGAMIGTRSVLYQPLSEQATVKNSKGKIQHITQHYLSLTAMPEYEHSSDTELRVADYEHGVDRAPDLTDMAAAAEREDATLQWEEVDEHARLGLLHTVDPTRRGAVFSHLTPEQCDDWQTERAEWEGVPILSAHRRWQWDERARLPVDRVECFRSSRQQRMQLLLDCGLASDVAKIALDYLSPPASAPSWNTRPFSWLPNGRPVALLVKAQADEFLRGCRIKLNRQVDGAKPEPIVRPRFSQAPPPQPICVLTYPPFVGTARFAHQLLPGESWGSDRARDSFTVEVAMALESTSFFATDEANSEPAASDAAEAKEDAEAANTHKAVGALQPIPPASVESQWRHCKDCGMLWRAHSDQPAPSRSAPCCFSSDVTEPEFALLRVEGDAVDGDGDAALQVNESTGWRRCAKCCVLFRQSAQAVVDKCCCAGGLHDATGSASYRLHASQVGMESVVGGQPGWRQCGLCQALLRPGAIGLLCTAAISVTRSSIGGRHVAVGESYEPLYLLPSLAADRFDWRHDEPAGEPGQWAAAAEQSARVAARSPATHRCVLCVSVLRSCIQCACMWSSASGTGGRCVDSLRGDARPHSEYYSERYAADAAGSASAAGGVQAAVPPRQKWSFARCVRCETVFDPTVAGGGVCAAGGAHQQQLADSSVAVPTDTISVGLIPWNPATNRWSVCLTCAAVHRSTLEHPGRCLATGKVHEARAWPGDRTQDEDIVFNWIKPRELPRPDGTYPRWFER